MSGKGLKKKIRPSRKPNMKTKSLKKEETNINILNDYCLIHIFEYLSLKDKLTLEFVSRRFNEVSKLSWSHVTSLDLDSSFKEEYFLLDDWFYVNERVNTAFVISVLRRCGNYLNYLYINGIDFNNLNWTKIFKECTDFLINLTELNIKELNIKNESLKQLFENNKNLKSVFLIYVEIYIKVNASTLTCLNPHLIEELGLHACEIDDWTQNLFYFLSNLSNIKVFKIESADYDPNFVIDALNLGNIQKLKEFSLTSRGALDFEKISEKISNLLARQKELCAIHLNEIPGNLITTILSLDNLEEIQLKNLNPEFLNALYRFTNLKSLKGTVSEFTDQILQKISKCMNLQKLSLTMSNFKLTSESANYFSNFEHLESLDVIELYPDEKVKHCNSLLAISKCESLTNLAIVGLNFEKEKNELEKFPNLEVFEIEESNISNLFLEDIVLRSPNLETCKIKDCNNITNEFIDSVGDIKSICCCSNFKYGELNYDCSCRHILDIIHYKTSIHKNSLESISRYITLEEEDF